MKSRQQLIPPEHVLIIASKDANSTPKNIQQQLATQLSPKKLRIPIKQIRPTRSKELLIRCASKGQITKLKEFISSDKTICDSLELRAPKTLRDSIIVFGVPSEFTAEDLISAFETHLSSEKEGAIHPETPIHRAVPRPTG
ncbi:hypothetical protein X975_06485, partial [Stegodyphus mimosarum]